MAQGLLIVNIEKGALRALVVPRGVTERRFFVKSLEKKGLKDALGALLDDIEAEGLGRVFDKVMLGIDSQRVSLRSVDLPFTDARKAEEVLSFELADSFVDNVDDLMLAAMPLSGGRTLAVSVEKRLIEDYLETFDSLGVAPVWVGLSLLYKDRLLASLGGSTTGALVDDSSIVVVGDAGPVYYNVIRGAMDLSFALAALQELGLTPKPLYCTKGAAAWADELNLEYSLAPRQDGETGLLALEGLYKAGLKGSMNLRRGAYVDKKAYESARKGFRLSVALACAVAVLWGASVFVRLKSPDKQITAIDSALKSAYSDIFKDESVVDPLYQLEIKLKEVRSAGAVAGSGIDALGLLKGLSGGVGEGGKVRLFDISMHSSRVTARGETDSFDRADTFRQRLKAMGAYNDISLTDVKTKSDGSVTFSISLTLSGEV